VKEPIAPGRVGGVLVTVEKDRPSGIRGFAEQGKFAAEMVVDATNDAAVSVQFERPTQRPDGSGTRSPRS